MEMGVIKEAIYLEVWFTCWVRVPIVPEKIFEIIPGRNGVQYEID